MENNSQLATTLFLIKMHAQKTQIKNSVQLFSMHQKSPVYTDNIFY